MEEVLCANPQPTPLPPPAAPGGALFAQPEVRARLADLVRSLTTDTDLQEDLLQEALLHLWQKELERPGQTLSWYLQSCHFHLLDLLKTGRSVHDLRHRGCLVEIPGESELTDRDEEWLKAEDLDPA